MFQSTLSSSLHHMHVQVAVFFIIFNPIYWTLTGVVEHNYGTISRILGSKERAVYANALAIIILGIVRDISFQLAIRSTPRLPEMESTLLQLAGVSLVLMGSTLAIASHYKLGIIGTYNGDRFGFLFPTRITSFPFSHFDHPMYHGATMCFLGTALVQASPVGLALATLAGLVYSIAARLEEPFTARIYSKSRKARKNN